MFGNQIVNYSGPGGIRRGLIWQSSGVSEIDYSSLRVACNIAIANCSKMSWIEARGKFFGSSGGGYNNFTFEVWENTKLFWRYMVEQMCCSRMWRNSRTYHDELFPDVDSVAGLGEVMLDLTYSSLGIPSIYIPEIQVLKTDKYEENILRCHYDLTDPSGTAERIDLRSVPKIVSNRVAVYDMYPYEWDQIHEGDFDFFQRHGAKDINYNSNFLFYMPLGAFNIKSPCIIS